MDDAPLCMSSVDLVVRFVFVYGLMLFLGVAAYGAIRLMVRAVCAALALAERRNVAAQEVH